MFEITTLSIDRYNEWNDFVDSSPQGDVFCYSWWLDTVTSSNFRIIAAIENGKIIGGMPLAYDEYGRINEPPLTRTLGVLYQNRGDSHSQAARQRNLLSELIQYIRIDEICQFCTHHNFTDWLPFKWSGLKQTTRYTYLLYYNQKSADDLRKNLNRGRKNIINRAIKNNTRISETEEPSDLYKCLEKSYDRKGLKINFSSDYFLKLDKVIRENGHRKILNSIDSDGKMSASIYVVYNKKSAFYLLSGSDPVSRHTGCQTLLLWEAIKYFSDKVGYFNFGGSDTKNIEEHFRGFGGVMTPYYHIYNEGNLHSNDVRYHLSEIRFHTSSAFKAIKSRLLAN